jgi:ADP-ribosylation factor-like protein 8
LGNKTDLPEAITVEKVIDEMFLHPKNITDNRELKKIEGREVSCYSISAKNNMNLEAVFKWLIARYSLKRKRH